MTESTVIVSPQNNLACLRNDLVIRVVVHRDPNKSNVAVISDGGIGYELAHVGFIGKDMLTATVYGDLFASSSADTVSTTIQVVTGEAGYPLTVKNYIGDRLNFSLAAEKAHRLGHSVEMLTVGDDISLPDNKHPRDITGTTLIHKVAGYFVERSFNLTTVLRKVQYVASRTASIGVALVSCHLPQKVDGTPRHQTGHAELGMGIHGEPGTSTIAAQDSVEIANLTVEKLTAALPETNRLTMMLNNLGGVSVAEMAILIRGLANTPLQARADWLISPASLVMALDMKDFSLSTIVLEEGIGKALLSDVGTAGWQTPAWPRTVNTMPSTFANACVDFILSGNPLVGDYIAQVTGALSGLEAHLNALDARAGDGDTGSTFTAGACEIADLLQRQQLPLNDLPALFTLIDECLTVVMGGSSGVLMSIFFTAAGQKLRRGVSVAETLSASLGQMKPYGGADEGNRIMIDAPRSALAAPLAEPENLQAALVMTQAGANHTCQSDKADAGRTPYLNGDSLFGNVDPGAHAIAMAFKALAG